MVAELFPLGVQCASSGVCVAAPQQQARRSVHMVVERLGRLALDKQVAHSQKVFMKVFNVFCCFGQVCRCKVHACLAHGWQRGFIVFKDSQQFSHVAC